MEGLFRTGNEPPPSGQAPPRPENKRVWASLLGGKAALIQEVAQETRRRDPEGIKTRVLWVLDRAPCESCCEVSQVVKGIRQSVTKRRIFGAKRKPLRGIANYLHRNRLRMRYDEYLAKGRPIARGPVEGACKNLLKDRMDVRESAGPKPSPRPSSSSELFT